MCSAPVILFLRENFSIKQLNIRRQTSTALKRYMPYDKDEQSYLSQLGARIRKLRKAKKLSQEGLAFEAGLDRTYVSSVERGERNIAVLNLAKLAGALGVGAAELLEEE